MEWIEKPNATIDHVILPTSYKKEPKYEGTILGIIPFTVYESVPVGGVPIPSESLQTVNGILYSDKELELGKKFDMVEDGVSYKGVMPITYYSENTYECIVDYFKVLE